MASDFQKNAFQNNFQQTAKGCAFQAGAFQNNVAFQQCPLTPPSSGQLVEQYLGLSMMRLGGMVR